MDITDLLEVINNLYIVQVINSIDIVQVLLNHQDTFFSILGIVISIYFGNTALKKKILYRIARKENSTLIAFWNTSHLAIKREDIYFLQVYSTKPIKFKEVYTSDEGVHLDETPRIISENETRDYELSFDFLLGRQGYIIQIDDSTAQFKGRLNGENKQSVELYRPVNLGELCLKELSVIILIAVFVIPILLIQEPTDLNRLAAYISALLAFCGTIPMIIGIVLLIYDLWNKHFTVKTCKEFNKKLKDEKYDEEKKAFVELIFGDKDKVNK